MNWKQVIVSQRNSAVKILKILSDNRLLSAPYGTEDTEYDEYNNMNCYDQWSQVVSMTPLPDQWLHCFTPPASTVTGNGHYHPLIVDSDLVLLKYCVQQILSSTKLSDTVSSSNISTWGNTPSLRSNFTILPWPMIRWMNQQNPVVFNAIIWTFLWTFYYDQSVFASFFSIVSGYFSNS